MQEFQSRYDACRSWEAQEERHGLDVVGKRNQISLGLENAIIQHTSVRGQKAEVVFLCGGQAGTFAELRRGQSLPLSEHAAAEACGGHHPCVVQEAHIGSGRDDSADKDRCRTRGQIRHTVGYLLVAGIAILFTGLKHRRRAHVAVDPFPGIVTRPSSGIVGHEIAGLGRRDGLTADHVEAEVGRVRGIVQPAGVVGVVAWVCGPTAVDVGPTLVVMQFVSQRDTRLRPIPHRARGRC